MAWDSPLSALAEVVIACAELEDTGAPVGDGNLRLARLVVEMPLELQTRTDDGVVALAVAPPRQAAETTVMPVLHRLRLVVEEQR